MKKFKVWSVLNEKWVTSNILIDGFGNMYWFFGGSTTMIDDKHNYKVYYSSGIKDKNGKEIYEGDEVKVSQERYNIIEYLYGIIGFQDGTFCIERTKQPERAKKQGCVERVRLWNSGEYDHYSIETIESFEIEIIGNVHENPELLNENKIES